MLARNVAMAVKTLVTMCYEINKCGNDVSYLEVQASWISNCICVQANSTRRQQGHILLLMKMVMELVPTFTLMGCSLCRDFDSISTSGSLGMEVVVGELEHATDVAGVLEEIGFGCTSNVYLCKEVLTLGGDPLDEGVVARILGTVARTAKGSEEVQSIHGSFFSTLCSAETVTSKSTSWNLEILLEAIHQLVSSWSGDVCVQFVFIRDCRICRNPQQVVKLCYLFWSIILNPYS
jgi:hypothetical protein